MRVSKLRAELIRPGIGGDVLAFCRPELLEGNYFHAVFEATKGVAQKIRDRTGLTTDGSGLVQEAFSIRNGRKPLLAWNPLLGRRGSWPRCEVRIPGRGDQVGRRTRGWVPPQIELAGPAQ